MEKVIITLLFILMAEGSSFAQSEQPADIINTELLINMHKKQQDALKKRVAKGIVITQATETVKQTTNTFEELHKQLSNRFSTISTFATTGLTAWQLVTEIKDTLPLITRFAQCTKYLTNLYVINEYIKTIEQMKIEGQFLTSSIKRIPLLKADAKSIMELLLEIQSRVTNIRRSLHNCLFMVQGYVALQHMKHDNEVIDKARIATKIIKRYSEK